MLSDTSVLPFYPSKFVLVTDILDTFGVCAAGAAVAEPNAAQNPPPRLHAPRLIPALTLCSSPHAGKLVFDRLLFKSTIYHKGSNVPMALPKDFTPDMVPSPTKEICRNWFYKIASIRELVPRIFVEASILRCLNYLTAECVGADLRRPRRGCTFVTADAHAGPLLSSAARLRVPSTGFPPRFAVSATPWLPPTPAATSAA